MECGTNLAHERYQVVLAEGEHLNVFDDHHFVVVLVEHSIV